MAISKWAVNPHRTMPELHLPGVMEIIADASCGAPYQPVPYRLGEMCDRCWIEDGYVVAVIHPECEHGGPRQGEHRNTATTASHGERRPSDPDRCRQCTRRQCDTRECRCGCHPGNFSRSLFGGAR